MPWRTLQLLAFVSYVHVIVNIVNKKTIYCRLITLEDNFFSQFITSHNKIKEDSIGTLQYCFLRKNLFHYLYISHREERRVPQMFTIALLWNSDVIKNGRRDRRYFRFAENYNSSKKAVNLPHDDTSRNHCSCVLYRV